MAMATAMAMAMAMATRRRTVCRERSRKTKGVYLYTKRKIILFSFSENRKIFFPPSFPPRRSDGPEAWGDRSDGAGASIRLLESHWPPAVRSRIDFLFFLFFVFSFLFLALFLVFGEGIRMYVHICAYIRINV
jgi:hypothetical protein